MSTKYTGHLPASARSTSLQIKSPVARRPPRTAPAAVPPPLSTPTEAEGFDPSVPKPGELVLSCMLSRPPRDRFATVADFGSGWQTPFTLSNPRHKSKSMTTSAFHIPPTTSSEAAAQSTVLRPATTTAAARYTWSAATRTESGLSNLAHTELASHSPASRAIAEAIKSRGVHGSAARGPAVLEAAKVLSNSSANVNGGSNATAQADLTAAAGTSGSNASDVVPPSRDSIGRATSPERKGEAALAQSLLALTSPMKPLYRPADKRAQDANVLRDSSAPAVSFLHRCGKPIGIGSAGLPVGADLLADLQKDKRAVASHAPGYAGHVPASSATVDKMLLGMHPAEASCKRIPTVPLGDPPRPVPPIKAPYRTSVTHEAAQAAMAAAQSLPPQRTEHQRHSRMGDFFTGGKNGGEDGRFMAAQFYALYRPCEGTMSIGNRDQQKWVSDVELRTDMVTRDQWGKVTSYSRF